jgi:hypothetical protein
MNSYENNGKVWVSDLNARPEIHSAFPRTQVRSYDTTSKPPVWSCHRSTRQCPQKNRAGKEERAG